MNNRFTFIGLALFASLMNSKDLFSATYCHIKGTPLAREKGTAPLAGQQPVPNYVRANTKNLTKEEAAQSCNAMLDQDWDGKFLTTETAPQNLYADHGVTLLTDSCTTGEGTECFCSNTQLLGICLKPVNGSKVVCNCNTPLTTKETESFLAGRKGLFETERQRLQHIWLDAVRGVTPSHWTDEQRAKMKRYQAFGALTDKITQKIISPWDLSIPEQLRLPTDNACAGKYPQAPCICGNTRARGLCGINRHAVNMKPHTLFCHCD